MFRLALKSVRHNPKRLILTALAVALGVSLVAASFTFTTALTRGFTDLFSEIYGEQDILVEADPDTLETGDPFAAIGAVFTDDDVAAVTAVDGVDTVVGNVQVLASILPAPDKQTDAPAGFGPPTQMFNWSGQPVFDRATIVDGRGPEADGEIVLDLDSAPTLGYEIGDTVQVAADEGIEEFTLVGTVRFGEDNQLQGATLAFVTTADAQRLAGEEGFYGMAVVVDDGASIDDVVVGIQEVLPDGTRAITGPDKAAEQAEGLGEVTKWINVFGLVFAFISLFVAAYLIVNTFRVIVTQRTRELGLLRAIGSSPRQIRTMILLEAVVVAIVASTLGIGMGYVMAFAIKSLLSLGVGDIFGAFVLPPSAILWSYVVGIVVTIGAALLPAIHASRIAPMEALRESATSGKKPLRTRNIVGAALLLLGVLAVGVGLFLGVPQPAIWVGVGAVLAVLGTTLLAAQVIVPLATGLRGLLSRWFGVDGKLATNNIRREPRRSANTAAALMIGVMLLAMVATFTESFKATVTSQFRNMAAELVVLPGQTPIPTGAVELMASIDGVDFVSTLAFGTAKVDDAAYSIAAIDPMTADASFDYPNDPDFTEMNGGVFIDPVVQALGYEVGDSITVEGPKGTLDLEVTGLYLNEGDSNLWVDQATGAELFGEMAVVQALVVLDEGADVDEVQAAMQEELSTTFPTVLLQQPGQLQQFANILLDLVLTIITGLLASSLIIALLGVANTLLLSVTERTREIGLLRAVGLKKRSVWRMITVESMVMAIFGTILGMVLGVSLGAALILALEDFGFAGVTVPWLALAVYTVLAAVAGVLAAVWPAWRASRLDILKAIAADG